MVLCRHLQTLAQFEYRLILEVCFSAAKSWCIHRQHYCTVACILCPMHQSRGDVSVLVNLFVQRIWQVKNLRVVTKTATQLDPVVWKVNQGRIYNLYHYRISGATYICVAVVLVIRIILSKECKVPASEYHILYKSGQIGILSLTHILWFALCKLVLKVSSLSAFWDSHVDKFSVTGDFQLT